MKQLTCPHCHAKLEIDIEFTIVAATEPNGSWRSTPLKDMELSTRAYNALHNMGCNTAGDIADKRDNELMAQDNFGRRSLWEVREAINELKKAERA